jgi:signal transduction histidine kinase
MVEKRGHELGEQPTVPGDRVRDLADMAGEQARALRAIIVREPAEHLDGMTSLRDALGDVAGDLGKLQVKVSAVGPIWLPAETVELLSAAVRQALENVRRHAEATRAAVFAEAEQGVVTVSVRDDGRGFSFDEEALRSAGKAGMLRSMRGRVQELGGRMRVETAPGAGTEIQFIVPVAVEDLS